MAALDYMVRHNTTDTTEIPDAGSSIDASFDTQVAVEGTAITYSSPAFDLVDVGKYLVLVSDHYLTPSSSDLERLNIRTRLELGGTPEVLGQSMGLVRKITGNEACINYGAAIIETTGASTALQIIVDRLDDVTTPSERPDRDPDRSGITIIKLEDADAYGRYSVASDTSAPAEGTPENIDFDTTDEQDAGFIRTGDTIEVVNAGQYVVAYTVPLRTAVTGIRMEFIGRLEANGTPIPGTVSEGYYRAENDNLDCCLSWAGIVDLAANDDLTLVIDRTEGFATPTNYLAGTGLQIWRLPDSAQTCIVEATGGDFNTLDADFAWDTNPHIDTDAFTHTPGSSDVDVDIADDYLTFITQGRTSFSNVVRAVPAVEIRVNTTNLDITGGSAYNRGAGTAGYASISAGGLATGLAINDSIIARNARLSTVTTAVACESGQMSILRMGSLVPVPPVVGKDFIEGSRHIAPFFKGTIDNKLLNVVTVNVDTLLTSSNDAVNIDSTSNNVTITLPAVASAVGKLYYLRRISDGGNLVTIDPGGLTALLTTQYESIIILSDGTEWGIY